RPAAPGSAAHKGLKEDRHRSHDQMVRKLLHTGRQPKKPVVELDDLSLAQVRNVINNAQQQGDDLVLKMGDTTIVLEDFSRTNLNLSGFIF
ncbi:MAG: hypothetical protein ACK5LJ_00765, partial [Paracoccus sp. (in: a-proteobacteria)]